MVFLVDQWMNEKSPNWLLQVAFKWSKLSGDLLSKLQGYLNGLAWLEMRLVIHEQSCVYQCLANSDFPLPFIWSPLGLLIHFHVVTSFEQKSMNHTHELWGAFLIAWCFVCVVCCGKSCSHQGLSITDRGSILMQAWTGLGLRCVIAVKMHDCSTLAYYVESFFQFSMW